MNVEELSDIAQALPYIREHSKEYEYKEYKISYSVSSQRIHAEINYIHVMNMGRKIFSNYLQLLFIEKILESENLQL